MLNKNERMEQLNKAGVNTGKYFTLDLPEGVTPGSKIHIIIDENGNPVVESNKTNDVIAEEIISNGYVRNTKLHRRFIMAQTFRAINYKSWDGKHEGYTEWLKTRSLKYAFDMMLEEVRVLSKLEVADRDTFLERSHFFTKDVIVQTMEDYMDELKKHVETLKIYKCKGVPYKKIKGRDVFVEDIQKKVYSPLEISITRIECNARNYRDIYTRLKVFMSNMVALPYNTPKSKAWIDAYKGEGAFYTLKNLIMFHGCRIENGGIMYDGANAMKILNIKLTEYKGEGWRMFALLKKVIKDNNFDFRKRMEEIYNK